MYNNFSRKIAKAGLNIKAIKLQPEDPFKWSSGYYMPIYNDNRMFLFCPEYRKLIADSFKEVYEENNLSADVIAGTTTGGIPHGVLLAERLNLPFVYIRDEQKSYGRQKRIEGLNKDEDIAGKNVIIVEDLISTGASTESAIKAVRNAGGNVKDCFCIFHYELSKAKERFRNMNPECNITPLLTYDKLIDIATDIDYIKQKNEQMLKKWSQNPFEWGKKHGYPKED